MITADRLGEVSDEIAAWIREQVTAAKATNAVFGLSGGADSALVAILCKKVFPKCVGVLMPCHSSQSSLDRAKELASQFDIATVTVDLGKAFESVSAQVNPPEPSRNKMAGAALRSCLRAPTLDYVAKLHDALIVGTGNRDEDEVTRYFQKRGDGSVDISPIAQLHKSEVYQLLRFLNAPKSIIDAIPTADLWGPDSGQADEVELGITYPEIEWAIQLDDATGRAIFGGDPSGCHQLPLPRTSDDAAKLLNLTMRQQQVLLKLRAMEAASRHKACLPPVYKVRSALSKCFTRS